MQKEIVKEFSAGNFEGYGGGNIEHIQTALSNIFIDGDLVYKICKDDYEVFNKIYFDLSKKENRHTFTTKDFRWNNEINSDVYSELKGVKFQDKKLVFTKLSEDPDELVIIMNKIDMSDSVFLKLLNTVLSPSDLYSIGAQLAEMDNDLIPKETFFSNPYEDFLDMTKDTIGWLELNKKYIPEDEAFEYVSFLTKFAKTNESELKALGAESMGVGIDGHSENALFSESKLLLIDTYPPKKEWRHKYKHINAYRLGSDIFALQGKAAYLEFVRGYESAAKESLNPEFEKAYVLYAACVMCPYLYILGENDPVRLEAAKKYHEFLKTYLPA